MADAIPANLRQPDIVRFLSRADQLRAFKPAMAYWCEYSAVLRIMKAGLHNSDDECYAFATGLMDRLESIKTEHAADSTVADDTVGRAFVQQFAQDTLDRADRTMRANKVSRTTADTYDAAATFFLVTTIWGDPDPDTGNKIKYAKWHAARILRAIREGRDPNESNPPPPTAEPASPVLQALDPDDPEVRALTEGGGSRPLPARVDNAPSDDNDSEMAGMPPPQYGRSPTAASSGPGPAPVLVSPTLSGPSMPDGLPDRPDRLRGGYGGGAGAAEEEYYDQVDTFAPSPMSQSPPPPPSLPSGPSSHLAPGPAPAHHAPSAPAPFDDPPERSPESFSSRASRASRASGPRLPPVPVDLDPAPPVTRHQPRPAPSWYAPSPPPPPGPASYSYDEKDVAAAQKHAKWAISALNFDDVATAVKELRLALEVLGG